MIRTILGASSSKTFLILRKRLYWETFTLRLHTRIPNRTLFNKYHSWSVFQPITHSLITANLKVDEENVNTPENILQFYQGEIYLLSQFKETLHDKSYQWLSVDRVHSDSFTKLGYYYWASANKPESCRSQPKFGDVCKQFQLYNPQWIISNKVKSAGKGRRFTNLQLCEGKYFQCWNRTSPWR